LIAGQKHPYPIAPRRKGKTGFAQAAKRVKRIYDTATMVALKGRGPEREPAIRSVLRAVILIVLGDVSEQRVARLLCRCKIIHLVGLRRSLVRHLTPNIDAALIGGDSNAT
jgi:hypothetical protein